MKVCARIIVNRRSKAWHTLNDDILGHDETSDGRSSSSQHRILPRARNVALRAFHIVCVRRVATIVVAPLCRLRLLTRRNNPREAMSIRIALDVMGGDGAPETVLAGAVRAAREYPYDIVLVGQESRVTEALAHYRSRPKNITIHHADDVVGMHESPAAAVRKKRCASVTVAAELVKAGHADALVTAGNTGAAVVASTLRMGLLEGVERPGIAVLLPTPNGITVLIDAGANIAPTPLQLHQYGIMGTAYAQYMFKRSTPRVGLLNVGEEESKGTDLHKEAYSMLEQTPGMDFVGNVEGRDIFNGAVDVMICDGFVGNVALKSAEALAQTISHVLRRELKRSVISRIGSWLARPAFRALRKELDYSEYGGAPLLGVAYPCIIAHGSSSGKAIKNAIRVAAESVENQLNQHMVDHVREATQALQHPQPAAS
jgi:phosphate acyltransferase